MARMVLSFSNQNMVRVPLKTIFHHVHYKVLVPGCDSDHFLFHHYALVDADNLEKHTTYGVSGIIGSTQKLPYLALSGCRHGHCHHKGGIASELDNKGIS